MSDNRADVNGFVARPGGPGRRCICGHPEDMHQHYRAGTDCGACSADGCPRYVPLYMRDVIGLSPAQVQARAAQDTQVWRTLRLLEEHGVIGPLSRIPTQRRKPEPRRPQSLTSAYREACTGKEPRRRR